MKSVQMAIKNRQTGTIEMVSIESRRVFRFQGLNFHIHRALNVKKREFYPTGWTITEESTGFACTGLPCRTINETLDKFFSRAEQAAARGCRLSRMVKQASRQLKTAGV